MNKYKVAAIFIFLLGLLSCKGTEKNAGLAIYNMNDPYIILLKDS